MLTDCKVGDWFKFKVPPSDRHHIGKVLEEPSIKDNRYKLFFYATVFDEEIYVKPQEHLQGLWDTNNKFISPYKPTIDEIFKIKQIQEKD